MSAREGRLPLASARVVAATLWRMLRGRRWRLAGVLALFVGEAATALVFPLVVGTLVDEVVASAAGGVTSEGGPWAQGLVVDVVALGGAAVASGVLAWLASLSLARLAETVVAELREDYVEAALALPRDVVEAAGVGDIVTRASDDIAEVSEAIPVVLPVAASSLLTFLTIAAGLGAVDPRFLLAFVVVAPLWTLALRWYLPIAPLVYGEERRVVSARGQQILSTLSSLPTVRAHGLAGRQLERVGAATWQSVRWAMRARIVQNRLFGRLNVTELSGMLAVLGIGVWLATTGSVTAGGVTAAALLYLRIVGPMQGLLFIMDDLQSALAALSRVLGVASIAGDAPRPHDANARHAALVRGLRFAYRDDVPVLRDVDLDLGRDESIAIVGVTGSGKSTLAAIVAGVHEPDAGTLSLGVPPTSVAVVTQETHVFAGTVRDNLTLAVDDADDAAVRRALDVVGATELVEALPDGLDTIVGHGGHALTAAEAQHLALARVVLADPALVILDEATADADTADASALDRAAGMAIASRASLVIAHRLSQAEAADRILVLEDGRVVERGTHAELLAADGRYAAAWHAWSVGRARD